jgi:DNA-binding transcriptional LysR family regulator
MTDIGQMRLRRLDLTVLLVFAGLMRHRKATAVAAEMGLTQSTISHALRRLRDVFGDPLFLRRPHGLEPTAVALALERPVRHAIETLGTALGGPPPFEPTTYTGTVRLAGFDSELATLLPGLIRHAAGTAPALRISARALGRQAALDALAAGEVDLALGFFWDLPAEFIAAPLFTEDFLVAGRAEVLGPPGALDLDAYAAAPHIVVSPAGDLAGTVDTALAALGRSRRVIAAVPLFFPAFAAAAETGCLVTLPRRLVAAYAPAFGLETREPPLALRRFPVAAIRHRRDDRNPLHVWLIAALTRSEECGDLR